MVARPERAKTYGVDDPAEPLWHGADVGQEHLSEMRSDEMVRETRVDDADHALGEPGGVEGWGNAVEENKASASLWRIPDESKEGSQLMVGASHGVSHLS